MTIRKLSAIRVFILLTGLIQLWEYNNTNTNLFTDFNPLACIISLEIQQIGTVLFSDSASIAIFPEEPLC
jgi:hypothetical protein